MCTILISLFSSFLVLQYFMYFRLIQMDKSVIMAAVGSVVKLVGRVAWTDVNRLILDTILVIARSNER